MVDLVYKQARVVRFYISDIKSDIDIYLLKMDQNKDVNLDTMSFERFWMWAVSSLKKYLHIRGKSTEWGIDDLATR